MRRFVYKVEMITERGYRGNPKEGAIGLIILDEKNRVIVKEGKCIVYTTNNQAEYGINLRAGLCCQKKFN